MSTTIELDESLAKELERRALQDGVSLAQFVEHVLKRELSGGGTAADKPEAPNAHKSYDMGEPKIPLERIKEFLDELDVEEYLRKSSPKK